jgi:hypothetical protein
MIHNEGDSSPVSKRITYENLTSAGKDKATAFKNSFTACIFQKLKA